MGRRESAEGSETVWHEEEGAWALDLPRDEGRPGSPLESFRDEVVGVESLPFQGNEQSSRLQRARVSGHPAKN
jgi:hypothetical protein